MSKSDSVDGGLKTTRTAFDIIEFVKDNDGARVSELAEELDLSKSTVYRHLSTLVEVGYMIKEADVYYLSLRFGSLWDYVRNRKDIYRLVKPKVKELASETEERAQFTVEEHGHMVYVHRETGDRAVKAGSGIGKWIPLHATAAGKVTLAFSPAAWVREQLGDGPLEAVTERTITDPDELRDELKSIRTEGVSYSDQEYIDGLRAVSVPVNGPDNQLLGALSISGPTHRLRGKRFREEIPDLLLGTANEIELNIAYE